MKKISGLGIILVMILSTTYLLGVEYYDKEPEQIQNISEAITESGLVIKEMGMMLEGVDEEDALTYEESLARQNDLQEELAHKTSCSKLCQKVHKAAVTYSQDEERGETLTTSDYEGMHCELSIRAKEEQGTTHYRFKWLGDSQFELLDTHRMRLQQRARSWGVNLKESLYFKGEIEGDISVHLRENYMHQIIENLEGKLCGIYQDDYNEKTAAYYGYTKNMPMYIVDNEGLKNNIQISFTYDENKDVTNYIIAFPFYNEPF